MEKILIIDDNKSLLEGMTETLGAEGYHVTCCENLEEGIVEIRKQDFPVVITDLKLPDGSGLDVLRFAGEAKPAFSVIVITAYGSVDTAVEAMKLGAFDFLTKPFPASEIVVKVKKAFEQHNLRNKLRILTDEAELLRREIRTYYDPDEIIGKSQAIMSVKKNIEQLAQSTAAILVLGETGTGKELIARAIHHKSLRRNNPFVKVNCAAIAETLIESELFGHEKGAFTGAHSRKPGRFELAHTGTIFLDEIAELSISAQAKFLRVLQEREFERVGGTKPVKADVRIVAATNKDLLHLVSEKKFREDLYYRLNVVPITLPPLRERREDIHVLLGYFLEKYARQNHKRIKGFTEEAMKTLLDYNWPGNIRELENAVERGVVLSDGEWIKSSVLPFSRAASLPPGEKNLSFTEKVAAFERELISDALKATEKNTSKAAKLLGISRSTLRYKIEKYSL